LRELAHKLMVEKRLSGIEAWRLVFKMADENKLLQWLVDEFERNPPDDVDAQARLVTAIGKDEVGSRQVHEGKSQGRLLPVASCRRLPPAYDSSLALGNAKASFLRLNKSGTGRQFVQCRLRPRSRGVGEFQKS
jgi:hypothetical protein